MMNEPRYTIDELTALTGFSRRTIRFYVEKGLVEPPAGRGRGGLYGDPQLQALRRIDAARKEGRSLASIGRAAEKEGRDEDEPKAAPAPKRLYRWDLAPGLSLEASDEAFAAHGDLIEALLRAAGRGAETRGENE